MNLHNYQGRYDEKRKVRTMDKVIGKVTQGSLSLKC